METCEKCGKEIVPPNSLGAGYGVLDGKKHCYECCGEYDKQQLREKDRATLYLSKVTGEYLITNWPGTLKIKPWPNIKTGRHNLARTRKDVWFRFEGQEWHGVQYGETTELLHCRKLRA